MTPSREFWIANAKVHQVVYFHSDPEAYAGLGLKGGWMPYFASRSAPLGEPGPHQVTALFHVFAPRVVHRAIPDAWRLADRSAVLERRLAVATQALTERFGTPDEELVAELEAIGAAVEFSGKPMAAALADLPAPADLTGRMWHAATILREYRGDCHFAALTAAGVDGAAALVLETATGRAQADFATSRGWSAEAQTDAIKRLHDRGWLTADGVATDAGREAREQLEATTDEACAAGFDAALAARAEAVTAALVAYTPRRDR